MRKPRTEKASEEAFGEKLRRLRKASGYSLQATAEMIGVTKGHLSKIENGASTPSIALLSRLSQSLGVSMAQLFESSSETPSLSLVRDNERLVVDRGGRELGYIYESLVHRKSDRTVDAFVLTMPPMENSERRYKHPGQEIIFILEGPVDFYFGDMLVVLESGDCVMFDSSIEHRAQAHGDKTARGLVVIIPEIRASKDAPPIKPT